MCGIAGYIGTSTNPDTSYKIMSKVFEELESRGRDAAGFWGSGEDQRVIYQKQPIRSSQMVHSQEWRKLKEFKPNILLTHARGASQGPPQINKNNHPFTSTDYRVGMVHNGKVPQGQYECLTKKFQVTSECDSEVILRIFEAGEDHIKEEVEATFPGVDRAIASRLFGLKDVWSYIDGSMAVAIGEILDAGHRRIWFFRNAHRPLWFADMRQELGQIFFVSTPDIWYRSVYKLNIRNIFNQKIKLIELPENEIWMMDISPKFPIVIDENVQKFEIETSDSSVTWEHSEDDRNEVKERRKTIEVITSLNDKDELDHLRATRPSQEVNYEEENTIAACQENFEMLMQNMRQLLSNLDIVVSNQVREGSMSGKDFEELVCSLEQTKSDLMGTFSILEGR